MDIEKMLLKGLNVDTSCPFQPCLSIGACKDLPLCEGTDEVTEREPKQAGEASVFNARHDFVNEYLEKKFGMDIYDFMAEYDSQFFGRPVCNPGIRPLFTCVFRKEENTSKLKEQMLNYQSSVLFYGHGSAPNLHDDSIFIFTLIECSDVTELKQCGGYYVSQNHRFVLKGSSQGDFTILYEKK